MFLNNIDGATVNESEIYTKCIYNVDPTLTNRSHDIKVDMVVTLRSAEAVLRFSLHGHHHVLFFGSSSWDLWDFRKFDTEWSKLILFNLGESLFF